MDAPSTSIKPIDRTSIHRITSGQVVIDLQTAVKELVENSLDAGAGVIEVRFKQYGLTSIEVVDNGCGIAEEDWESVALKHHTSKLASFADLTTLLTFGFRGEALSSLCALCEGVSVTTATKETAPMGALLEMEASGRVRRKGRVARQPGTTTTLTSLFLPLPVRRKELERNAKREFAKALSLLNAYALGPCAAPPGVRLVVNNWATDKGPKQTLLSTHGAPSPRASVSALWGPKALENVVDLELGVQFEVQRGMIGLRAKPSLSHSLENNNKEDEPQDQALQKITVHGLISSFAPGCGRTGTDRQFFYVNGRPCNLGKIQKAFNEVYRTFNVNQAPFIVADFRIPTESCDINVSPDKRTIFLHSEANLIAALKIALESHFASMRATYDVGGSSSKATQQKEKEKQSFTQTMLNLNVSVTNNTRRAARERAREKEKGTMGEKKGKRGAEEEGENEGNEENEEAEHEQQAPFKPTNRQPSAPRPPAAGPSSPAPIPTSSSGLSSAPSLGAPSTHLPSSSIPDAVPLQFHPRPESILHSQPPSATQPLFIPDPEEDEDEPPTPSFSSGKEKGREKKVDGPSVVDRDVDVDMSDDAPQQQHQQGSEFEPEPETEPERASMQDKKGREKEKDVTMVLDTTQASWSRNLGLGAAPSPRDGGEDEDEGNAGDDEPARKKRKSDAGIAIASDRDSRRASGIQRAPARKAPAKDARDHLRSRLSGFARTGSQVPVETLSDDDDEEDRDGDEENQEQEEDQLNDEDEDDSPPVEKAPLTKSNSAPTPAPRETPEVLMDVDSELPSATASSPIGANGDDSRGTGSSSIVDLTIDDDGDDDGPPDTSSVLNQALKSASAAPSVSTSMISRPEIIKSTDASENEDVSLRFDAVKVAGRWGRLLKARAAATASASSNRKGNGKDTNPAAPAVPLDAGVSNTEQQDKAADALARVIEKADFGEMQVLGQFNLGFIVVRRRKCVEGVEEMEGKDGVRRGLDEGRMMDDLFIVDQHAADEKYNFETLQQTTRIQSQKLFRPQPLELTASDELLTMENLNVLRQNGFELDADEGEDAGPGSHLKLTAQPVSKSTVFDMKDLEELIHLMRDRPTGTMVRCSKARAMFAMRACRKSVMVGMPLNRHQMSTVVRHMGTMDQPWNCPHGRPTMRHLLDIAGMASKASSVGSGSPTPVDWSAFC